MNFEEKYKMFGLDNEKVAIFRDYSAGFSTNEDKFYAFTIKTVVIEKVGSQFEATEKDDAKLV